MRLLVYPHDLAIGGSQINAIDLAAGAAAEGHDVIVYGITGPLASYIEERGLRFIPAHPLKYRPAPTRITQIARIARRERIDLIHAYEWPASLDCYFGAGLFCGIPIVCTVLSMSVMPQVPDLLPLIMGTANLGQEARQSRSGDVWVLEPPIDTERDSPAIDGADFRRATGVTDDELLVVSVSRLAVDLKLDALVRAIDAVDMIADEFPLKLVLVGDGPARAALAARADGINFRHGRQVIALPGSMLDPREAYAGADLVVGMGSSALRAMSIGRPVVVQGEQGFSEIFEPATQNVFLQQGFYGLADGASGSARLARQMESLLMNPERRRELGHFGRKVVCERFSLARAVGLQLDMYSRVLAAPPRRSFADATRSARMAMALELSNHDPQQKRRRQRRDQEMLKAASSGYWPPVTL